MSSSDSSHSNDPQWEASLTQVEQTLQELKTRYVQVGRDRQQQQELQAQLQQIQEQLAQLEIALESRLFSWKDSLAAPFWQAVRFGGIGIILGWLLKSCAG